MTDKPGTIVSIANITDSTRLHVCSNVGMLECSNYTAIKSPTKKTFTRYDETPKNKNIRLRSNKQRRYLHICVFATWMYVYYDTEVVIYSLYTN